MHSLSCLQARGQLEEARALCRVPVEHQRPGGCGAWAWTLGRCGEGGGMGRRTRAAKHARLMRAVDKVLCRTNTQRLIGSFL